MLALKLFFLFCIPKLAMTCDCAEQPPLSMPLHLMNGRVPIIQIAFRNDMWWSMPQELSHQIYQCYAEGWCEAGYVWDWGAQRDGSYCPEGKTTSLNRYVLNFSTMQQQNIDNGRLRSFRIIWMDDSEVQAKWCGEKT